MDMDQRQEVLVAVRKGIEQALEPIYDEMVVDGVWGLNTVALAAEAATSVIVANFDGQESAIKYGIVKRIGA